MTQTREKWNSHVLSILSFEWYEDAMVFRVSIFIFCLEPTLGKDTWMRATSTTVMAMF